MICKACLQAFEIGEDIMSRGEYSSTQYEHHQTLDDLRRAVERGCYLCRRFLERLIHQSPQMNHSHTLIMEELATMGYVHPYGESLHGRFDLELCTDRLSENFVISFEPVQNQCVHQKLKHGLHTDHLQAESINLSTGSTETLDQVRAWLKTCNRDHLDCKDSAKENLTYPERLVEIEPARLPEGYWALIETSHNLLESGYATLSHRWGEDFSMTKLTQETYHTMASGMKIDLLSSIYRDVIKVAKHVGIRYLWIDSICKLLLLGSRCKTNFVIGIEQDPDKLNVKMAAQQMADIYYNAECNISCLNARQDSLFTSRDVKLLNTSSLYIPGSEYSLNNSYVIEDKYMWRDVVPESPLSKRGWIYQEQILAKRTISFGQDQVFWDCPAGSGCELLPSIEKREIDFDEPIRYLWKVRDTMRAIIRYLLDEQSLQNPSPWATSSRLYTIWSEIVRVYSARDLTYNSDKLLAIAGLARPLAQISGDTYLAGMWKSTLPQSLLWYGGDDKRRASSHYRVPSWSWASVDGDIAFPRPSQASTIISAVSEAYVNSSSESPFDIVDSSHLRLRAPCLPIVLQSGGKGIAGFSCTFWTDDFGGKFVSKKVTAFVVPNSTEVNVEAGAALAAFISFRRSIMSPEINTLFEGLILRPSQATTWPILKHISAWEPST